MAASSRHEFVADTTDAFTTTKERFANDTATGQLFYDAGGSATRASRVLVVTLVGYPQLSAGDFFRQMTRSRYHRRSAPTPGSAM
jgi:hypothetical protein